MKRRIRIWPAIAAGGLAASAVTAQTPGADQTATPAVAIAPGTEIELMVLAEVNTRISAPGSIVRLRLNRPVMANGTVLLPVGTLAFGKVDALDKSGIALSRGSIRVRMTHIATPAGPLPLADVPLDYRARGGKADDVAKLLLVPFYAAFSPANSAKLKAGELVYAHVAAPVAAPAVASVPADGTVTPAR